VERSDPKTLSQNRKTLTLFIAHIAYNDIQVTTTSEGSAIMAKQTAGYENSVETIARKHEYGFEWTTNGGKVKDVEAAIEKGLVERNRQPRTVGGFINEYRLTTAGRDYAIAQGWIAEPPCEHGIERVHCAICTPRPDTFPKREQPAQTAAVTDDAQAASGDAVTLDAIVALVVDQYDDNPLAIKANKQLDAVAELIDAQQATIDAQAAEIAALKAQIKRMKKTANLDDGYIEFLEAKRED
jgi:hypothetical protein